MSLMAGGAEVKALQAIGDLMAFYNEHPEEIGRRSQKRNEDEKTLEYDEGLKAKIAQLEEGKYGVRHISHCAAAWPIVEKSQLLARIKQLNAAQENLAPQQRVAYTDETIKFVGPFLHLHLGNPRTGGKI